VAEAHQWLFLDRPDRVWAMLTWLWDHQASPGMYTWGEGTARTADPFRRWDGVRGWVKAPYVTPHYWTAAEMLMLQLDMLAYVDEANGRPTLVVGAGVPPAWLTQPMNVRRLPTRIGHVDWTWNGREVAVAVRGSGCDVRLASVFPPTTPLRVRHIDSAPAQRTSGAPCT